MPRLVCVFAALLLQACAVHHYPLERPARPTAPLPDHIRDRFEYASITSASLTPSWSDDEVEVFEGRLEVRVPGAALGEDDGTTPVEFEYWRSKVTRSHPAPVVLVTPILGGGRRLARTQCGDFSRAGLHVILAWRGTRVLRRSWPVEAIELYMRRGIAARRALLDWAETRPEIDADRMAAFGISMGGIITTVLLAAEPRLHSGVIALAGGDLPGLLCVSSEGRLVRFRTAKMRELGLSVGELEHCLGKVVHSDPQLMARAIDPQRVLQITSRYDTVVPLSHQEALWEALGRPLRYDLPTGHYSGILFLPYVTRQVVKWLTWRMNEPAEVERTEE